MCGRFTLRVSPKVLAEYFELTRDPDILPRPDIRPTQAITAVVRDSESGNRTWCEFRWGLIPSWSKAPRAGAPLINARSETVAEKPAFRAAFKRRRCLIPADGFYEWKSVPGQKKKQPYYISVRETPVIAMAGIWESWEGNSEERILSCTILTTQANAVMTPLHDRMPVILNPQDFEQWLDPSSPVEDLSALLRPYSAEAMVMSAEIADELLSGKTGRDQQRLF